MSNSKLVDVTIISSHSSNPRNKPIKKITIHHMAGNASIETLGRLFADPERKGSANYGIGTDGRVGMYVEEKNRAWTSSNAANDHQAVTIEVANDVTGGDWHVSDAALNKLIELCVDICKRNKIERLNYTGDKTGNLTRHNMFAATACPGPYLQSKFPYIADEVNKLLSVAAPAYSASPPAPKITTNDIGCGVKLSPEAVVYGGTRKFASFVYNSDLYLRGLVGDRAVISTLKVGAISGAVDVKYLTKI